MSGIFGIFNLDGKPVPRADLEAMQRAMDYWGPHGSAIWQEGNIGLGHLLLHNTPESVSDSQPLRHPPSGVVLNAHARIDNRDELIADLRFEIEDWKPDPRSPFPDSQSLIPDSHLILHAYLRWGEDCVHHLLGDWAFALWDPRQQKLFLACNHFGISSLYYYRGAGFLAFASSIKGLLALPQVPQQPNLLRIAQVLTAWPGDGILTGYEGILQLPNAHTMTITADGTRTRRYWYPADTPPLRFASDDDYVEAFLEIYTEAVRCRLRTPPPPAGGGTEGGRIGATLSSGLDSGSVCALAARELRARGGRLTAFTSIPIYPTAGLTGKNWYGNEAPLVEINRAFIPNLDVHYIRSENFGPLAGITRALALHDSPMHAGGNMFWVYDLLQTARRQGLGVLLTGQVGNGSVSWSGGGPENYWPLLLAGRWGELRHKAKNDPSLTRALRSHFLRPLAQPIRNQFARLRQVGRPPWADYAAIHPDFARALDLQRQMQVAGHDPFFTPPADPRQTQRQLFRLNSTLVGIFWAEMGAAYNLEARDPTMDKRLTEFCMAIPQEQYRRNGQERALIRRAMMGLLPDEVRLNTRRGRQAADLGHRLLAELPQVQALLSQLEACELARTVLDLPKMQSVLAALQAEVNYKTTTQSMTILTRGLMAGMFLLRFEQP
jgi:asparagine synthase (glutamine-hydrolysing)